MIPTLFELGPLKIHSFGFALAVAFLLIAWLAGKDFPRRGYSSDAAWSVVLAAMIGGVVGAKVWFLVDHWQATTQDPIGALFSGAGLTYYGGLIGGAAAVLWVSARHGIPTITLLDLVAPLLALGYGVGRIGCFLNGDDYGKVTDSFLGMAFPKGSPPTTETVHPTQIYEAAAGLALFAFLWFNRKRFEKTPGLLWGLYLVLAGLERFLVEFLRLNEPGALGLTPAQWVSVILMLLGVATLVWVSGRRSTGSA